MYIGVVKAQIWLFKIAFMDELYNYFLRYKFNRRLKDFPDYIILGDRYERKKFLKWLNKELDKKYYNYNKGE